MVVAKKLQRLHLAENPELLEELEEVKVGEEVG